jgi:hypothetical protein
MTAKPHLPEVDDLEALLQQATSEPSYSVEDIALIEERLQRFEQIVAAAYHRIEELPESARQREQRRQDLLKVSKEFCDTVRFCIRCGIPAAMEMGRLESTELQILLTFPDAAPHITRN